MIKIPIARPQLGVEEATAVSEVLASGQLAQGAKVLEFEQKFAAYVRARHVIATSSGTTALHLALLAHGVGKGDEVVTTSFSFVATANAILYTGARPVFADVDGASLNLDPEAVARAVTPRTRAILPVHLFGNPADMEALRTIADHHRVALIEDACQAHGAMLSTNPVGSRGTACFSFYPTKNMTTAEGGAIATDSDEIADRCRSLRAHGARERYLHTEVGFNYRMTDVHAAIGVVQLARLPDFNDRRRRNAEFFQSALSDVPQVRVRPGNTSANHQFTLLLGSRRDELRSGLNGAGIGVEVYYPTPIHLQPAYGALRPVEPLPVTEHAAASVLSIPVHPGLTDEELGYIAREVSARWRGSSPKYDERPTARSDSQRCRTCGVSIDEDDRYCPHCGASVTSAPLADTVSSSIPPDRGRHRRRRRWRGLRGTRIRQVVWIALFAIAAGPLAVLLAAICQPLNGVPLTR